MARPKCYDPQDGHYAQLLYRYGTREWEHLDYASDPADLSYLMEEYRLAYRGTGGEISYTRLPEKYWDKEKMAAWNKKRHEDWLAKRKAKRALLDSTNVNQVINQIISE